MNTEIEELVLAFDSWQRAQDAADELFKKGLATQIEFLPVKSTSGEQIKLIVFRNQKSN